MTPEDREAMLAYSSAEDSCLCLKARVETPDGIDFSFSSFLEVECMTEANQMVALGRGPTRASNA